MNSEQQDSGNVYPLNSDTDVSSELVDSIGSEHFINRELSLLQFNRRVLQQSLDPGIPILERLRYLSICSNNLDEFFEVRVAGLRHRVSRNDGSTGPDGQSPTDSLKELYEEAKSLVADQYQILNEVLYPELSEAGVHFPARSDWSEEDYQWIRRYFTKQVAPVITPISLDLTHPFPRLINKSLHFLLRIEGNDAFGRNLDYAVLHMPRSLPRLIELPGNEDQPDGYRIILLAEIIREFVSDLFPGVKIKGCYQFRLTRDSDLSLDDFEVDDLADVLKEELSSRDFGASVRLEVSKDCPVKVRTFLLQKCGLDERELFEVDGPVNLNRYFQLNDLVDRSDLKFDGFTPSIPVELEHGNRLLDRIAERDHLLHHPFQSFWPVVDLIREAAHDPNVLAIQQTLYRSGSNSPIVDAMIDAAHSGKEVTAVIELRARFDEADNIQLAQRLQSAGVLVVYGVMGYKTHAKMMLIVRREKNKLKRYVHLSTGNYHVDNARAYTDYSLMTANKRICEDVQKVFQQLTGMGKVSQFEHIWIAPFTLRKNILAAIDGEIANAKNGKRGLVVAKMNSLTDRAIIERLYRASQAGVEIRLIVRGICALRPGIPGLSENIGVRSVVGRFLEHSRCFYFYAEGEENVYCSSADWMGRNLDRRVEICFPILQEDIKARLIEELLNGYLEDTRLSWQLDSDGEYSRFESEGSEEKIQDRLLRELTKQPF